MRESDTHLVLLIGLSEDSHVQSVASALQRLSAPTFFFDPSESEGIPILRQVGQSGTELRWQDGRTLSTGSIRSVFCRYAVERIIVNPELPDIERFALSERLQAALSALRTVESTRWINDPWHEARADCKLYQTHLAAQMGMKTPNQIISNIKGDILEFLSLHSKVIIKPISDTSLGLIDTEFFCDRPIPSDRFFAPYTSDLIREEVEAIEFDDTPSLVQCKIEAGINIRAVVVDRVVLAYEIQQESSARPDFRLNSIKCIEPHTLPDCVVAGLVGLVQKMNLRFDSCDLMIDRHGNYIFLEANVSGNWLFCELCDNFRVSNEIARALCSGHG